MQERDRDRDRETETERERSNKETERPVRGGGEGGVNVNHKECLQCTHFMSLTFYTNKLNMENQLHRNNRNMKAMMCKHIVPQSLR